MSLVSVCMCLTVSLSPACSLPPPPNLLSALFLCLFLSISPSFCLTLPLLFVCLSASFTHSLALALFLTLSHSLSHSLFLSLSLSLALYIYSVFSSFFPTMFMFICHGTTKTMICLLIGCSFGLLAVQEAGMSLGKFEWKSVSISVQWYPHVSP